MDSDVLLVNERVRVVARYADRDGTAVCYPVKMQHKGREYVFSGLGLRHPTTKGKRMVHVFDMSDGTADYRLEFDAENLTWTLICIEDRSYAPIT